MKSKKLQINKVFLANKLTFYKVKTQKLKKH